MSKESSFDVVSRADINEVRNAVNMAQKEIATRYDFKKSVSAITLEGEALVLVSDDDGKLKQVVEVLEEKLVRRKVPLKALQYGKVEEALGGSVRQRVPIAQGIPDDKIKAMNKLLRQRFKKVKSQIQGDTLRVFSASKDELADRPDGSVFPQAPRIQRDDVVFWSSNIASGMEHTVAGAAPGYFRDALVYFSERRPVARASSRVAFLSDVALGVLLGYLFGFLWRRYAVAAAVLGRIPLTPAPRKFVAWLNARAWLVAAIGVLPLILWLALVAAGYGAVRGQWLNPLPIIVGMFIDGLLQSRQRAGDRHPHSLREYVSRHPDTLLVQLPLIAIALILLATSR